VRYPALLALGITMVFLLIAQTSHSAVNHIEFRIVLNDEEVGDKDCNTVIDGDRVAHVWKPYFLSDSGIAEIMVFRSAVSPGKMMAGLMLNDQGKKQLSVISKKFSRHRVAIFVNNAFITILPVLPANSSSDMVVIVWPGKEKELCLIASHINKKPESVLTLYIDEIAKYNDVAADEWAKVYERITKAMRGSDADKTK